jgi:hypothetical protein
MSLRCSDDVTNLDANTPAEAAMLSKLLQMHEPSSGGDQGCNVGAVAGHSRCEIQFVTLIAVREGVELFIDYGKNYDRSGYKASSDLHVEAAKAPNA